MRSTMVVVLILAVAIGWPATSPSRSFGPRPCASRSSAPGPRSWWSSSSEWGRGERAVACLAVGIVGFAMRSPVVIVVAPLLLLTLLRERARRRRLRSQSAHAESLLEFVDALSAGLRAGASLSGSAVAAAMGVGSSSPSGFAHPGLRRLVDGVGTGRSLPAAFADAFSTDTEVSVDGHRSGRSDEQLLAVTIIALEASGGSAAGAVDRVGDALRERCAARADARTQAQQALSSAAVMAVLPLIFGLAAAVAEPAVGHLYRSTWLGAACAGSAVGLTLLGWEWQRRLIEVLR